MVDTPTGITINHHQPADASASLRVLIVDGHALACSGVHSELIAYAPGLDIIAEVDDVEGIIAAVHALQLDAVLLDIHLFSGSGEGGVKVAASCYDVPEICFLALSVPDVSDGVVRVIQVGARGYVTKAISTEDLAQIMWRVTVGDAAFSPRLAGFALDTSGAGAGEVAVADIKFDRFSARERKIMRFTACGHTYKECASELFIPVRTVKTYVSAVLYKLQLSNRSKFTRWAVTRCIVQGLTASRVHPGSGSRDAPTGPRPDDGPVSRPGLYLRTVPPPT